jgi:aryl-alcohol dehydrogenase-like predicted oxidoreductase
MIATKARFAMGKGPNDSGLSRFHLIQACEASLKRLNTDVIDLYQMHQWDGTTPLEETMEALDRLIRQGKVRYIGCSNFSAWHIMKAMGVAERHGYQPFVSQQIYYSVDGRDAEFELVPVSIDQGIGILVWSPLAGGLLTGKHRRDHTVEGTRRAVGGFGAPIQDEDRTWKIVDTIVAIAKERGVTGSQVALAWLLERPGVTSLIIGGRNEAQFKDNLGAAELKLSKEEVDRLEQVGRPFLLYPYWHQLRAASDRMSPADATLLAPRLTKP